MAEVAIQKNKEAVQVRASARSLHLSPRKMRLVTNLVKGLSVNDAMTQLAFTNKKGAKFLVKLLQSAVANAENNFSLNADKLFIKTVTCDMGQTMKRYFPRARGSAFIIRRKLSHVNVILEEQSGPAAKKSRFAMLRRAKKAKPVITQEGSTGTPEQAPEASVAKPADERPDQTMKTGEQVKANKIQNKRRLYNRRTGE